MNEVVLNAAAPLASELLTVML